VSHREVTLLVVGPLGLQELFAAAASSPRVDLAETKGLMPTAELPRLDC
jgi:hypothetical protein